MKKYLIRIFCLLIYISSKSEADDAEKIQSIGYFFNTKNIYNGHTSIAHIWCFNLYMKVLFENNEENRKNKLIIVFSMELLNLES